MTASPRGPASGRQPPQERWDARTYQQSFGYVSRHGEAVLDLLDAQPGERILDLGCGTGELAARIADAGAHVEGIDADEAMIAEARKRRPDLVFRCVDGHEFTVTEPFDAVFSNAALHWMLRPAEVIARVWDALRPGGRFVGEMGAEGNVQTIIDGVAAARAELGLAGDVPMPWFFPSVATYTSLLEAQGFEVRSAVQIDRPTPLEDCEDGVADWVRMFGQGLLADIPAQHREEVAVRTADLTRAALQRDGVAYADYQRLRFAAVRPRL